MALAIGISEYVVCICIFCPKIKGLPSSSILLFVFYATSIEVVVKP